jgi:FAD:protein FMN transferase
MVKYGTIKVVYSKLRLTLLSVLTLLAACGQREAAIENFHGYAQGTTYSIVYADNIGIEPEELKEEVDDILLDFDMSLSLYRDSSVLSRINRNEDVIPDNYFIEAFRKSVEISAMTGGAFDITIGPLARSWGFGPDEKPDFAAEKLDSLLNLVGMDKVWMENGRLIKADPAVTLDFNAIAQGYSVDVISRYFDRLGLKNYLVEIGGEVRARGSKNGARWRIGIDRPEENNFSPGEDLQAVIHISDESLATSGNYRKFYEKDGIKYSHTIDPATGYPARNNLLSVTIIAPDCATADGIATACMVMGMARAREYIEKNTSFLAFFVYSDEKGNFRTWTSTALAERITETGINPVQ